MYVCAYVCMLCMYVCMHVCICACMYVCMYVLIYMVDVLSRVWVCVRVIRDIHSMLVCQYLWKCMYACMNVCMYVCMYPGLQTLLWFFGSPQWVCIYKGQAGLESEQTRHEVWMSMYTCIRTWMYIYQHIINWFRSYDGEELLICGMLPSGCLEHA